MLFSFCSSLDKQEDTAIMSKFSVSDVATALDFAVLKPQQTRNTLDSAITLCRKLHIGCLCVRPTDVCYVKSQLRDQTTLIASVVGFPHGANRTVVKVQEAKLAIEDGAVELDMVMAIGDFLNGNDTAVHDDIAAVVNQALPLGVPVKVILETCFLTNEEVVKACRIVESAKAQYVKTSTGFGPQGATREVVKIMLATVDGRLGVKASGGIRTWHECVDYLSMGCTRIGVGDPLTILNGSPD